MKLIYGVEDKPKFGYLLVLALQQLLAIITATLVVPVVVNQATGAQMSSSAALLNAIFRMVWTGNSSRRS